MWQSNGKKRSSLGSIYNTPLRESARFHLKRVECLLTALEGSMPNSSSGSSLKARLLLNDLSPEGLAVYSTEILASGTLVALELQYPEEISLRLRVNWCQQITGVGRVISSAAQSYRIGLIFDYENAEERERVRSFCEKLAGSYPGRDLTKAPYAA
ncbi:MAG: PilZ domain-containing protein [Bdellovibrionales bacterium]|nr:PilZ domain-containing protein [Bdellovibrionales bacterium]